MASPVPALPGLPVLRHYRRSLLRGDLLAGVTVAAYLVPQVMAYASVAGLPPVVGLWAILPAIVLYALVGSSRLLSVGPESTTALMTATVVGPLAGGDPERYAVLASALAVAVGLMCVVAWAARLGFVADLLSRPVLIGYLAGVALIMMVDQLTKLTGVPTDGSEFFPKLASFFGNLDEVHPATVIFSAATLVVLYLATRFRWRVPGPLLVLVAGTAVVAAFGLEDHGLAVIGKIPAGLPARTSPRSTPCPNCCCPRSVSCSSGTPTSSSPRVPSRPTTAVRRWTRTRNCWPWAPRTSARAPFRGSR